MESPVTLEEELRECLPYIGHIHIKNYSFNPELKGKPFQHVDLGKGDIDFKSLAAILRAEKYDGPISIEPEVGTAEEIEESLRYYREVFELD